ncbi:MAG TPA: methionine synthase [Candidatus Ozemobacteraceae bacterium]|nr:methionine synthase [Candidatus Ozemobacteraceae bacterium]
MITPERFLAHLRERILVFDGAMGTNLQRQQLTTADFGGFDGCNEALNLFAPHAVRKVHADFVAAGCRAVETNTFGANRLTLAEYGLENKVDAINKAAVRIAREALETGCPGEQRFVAASIGPTSRLPSLGHIGFEEMAAIYVEQVRSLWDAGADIFVVETCQDLLQVKAALNALARLFRQEGARRPVMVSVTLEAAGTMLMGSDIGAVQSVLEPFGMIDVIGINCATGPLEMMRHVKVLAESSGKAVSVMPNAGLPENVDGKPVYRLPPAEFGAFQKRFVEEYGVNVVGGCCGTTPEHLAAVAAAVGPISPKNRDVRPVASAASMYGSVGFIQEPPPCLVGERTNANGSRMFRDLLLANDWEGMTAMGKQQARGGAHLIDLSTAYVGRSEITDMCELAPRFAKQVKLPLMIDSTDPAVIEAVLQRHGGRCVINSVNLEDGGVKLRTVAGLARDYGAALICLAIDEKGMARTLERKLAVVRRLHDVLTREFGLRDEDLVFDTLTFTVGSGDPELRASARETLDAVKAVSTEFPRCFTILGVSNVSFGLAPEAREVLNSVFLSEAVANGLKMAIVNPAGILPPFKIPPRERELALNLLHDASRDGSDLGAYMQAFAGAAKTRAGRADTDRNRTPAEMIRDKVLDGDRTGIEAILDSMRHEIAPETIITDHLIAAMREVGELFGRGEMQLPFVLQSAEIVRAAVGLLKPHLSRKDAGQGPAIILATVSGDVHDIGKNLVKILFENNGYRVIDLGIKVDIDTMIRAAQEHGADIIGMSGLLVRSTQIMKENLEELLRRGLRPSVILGGAALTREYVESDLRTIYGERVQYAADAFDGLRIMDGIVKAGAAEASASAPVVSAAAPRPGPTPDRPVPILHGTPRRSVLESPTVWYPPFFGTRRVTHSLDSLLERLDTRVLFQARWGYKQGNRSDSEYEKHLREEAQPALEATVAAARRDDLFQIRGVYGFFRCRAAGNELMILDETGRTEALFAFPRQAHEPGLCVADFFSSAREDVIVLWAATVGPRVAEKEAGLMKAKKYRDYLHIHGLGVELAERAAAATAELAVKDLAGQAVPPRALRFSFGFPACPNLTAQRDVLRLLEADRIGISLTETCQMVPELSVSGFQTLHPDARYFQP